MKYIKHAEVTERLRPLDEQALKEIREILEGVKSGRLLHNQTSYHTTTSCGTAHCIAGWKANNDAIKEGLEIDYGLASEGSPSALRELMFTKSCTRNVWAYAQLQWGLDDDEALALFSGSATLEEQFEMLELLESCHTIEYED